jgi:hypothetical protein
VRAVLHDVAVLEDDDAVRTPDGREPMRDEDRRQAARQLEETVEERRLGADVEIGGGLVEHEHAGAALDREQRPGDRDPLPLPARELGALGVLAREGRVQALWQGVDELQRTGTVERGADPLVVVQQLHRAVPDVLAHGQLVVDEVLEDRGHTPPPRAHRVLTELAAVDEDAAGLRLVQPGEQLDQGRLAGAVQPYDRQRPPGLDREVEVAQHRPVAVAVAEGDPVEADLAGRHPFDGGRARGLRLLVGDPALQSLEARERAEPVLGLVVGALDVGTERADQQDALEDVRELAQGQRPGRRGTRGADGRDRAEDEPDRRRQQVRAVDVAPTGLPDGIDRLAGARPVAVAEPVEQPEDADLLPGRARRDQVAVVVAPAPLRREPGLEAAVPAEAGPDHDSHRQRPTREEQRRPPGVDNAHERSRDRPLQVDREQEQRRPARPARREPGAAMRIGEVRERVEGLGLLEHGHTDGAERRDRRPLAQPIVDLPGERERARELQRADHLLRHEEHAGDEQRVAERAPLGRVEAGVDRGRDAADDRARRDDERDRHQAGKELHHDRGHQQPAAVGKDAQHRESERNSLTHAGNPRSRPGSQRGRPWAAGRP